MGMLYHWPTEVISWRKILLINFIQELLKYFILFQCLGFSLKGTGSWIKLTALRQWMQWATLVIQKRGKWWALLVMWKHFLPQLSLFVAGEAFVRTFYKNKTKKTLRNIEYRCIQREMRKTGVLTTCTVNTDSPLQRHWCCRTLNLPSNQTPRSLPCNRMKLNMEFVVRNRRNATKLAARLPSMHGLHQIVHVEGNFMERILALHKYAEMKSRISISYKTTSMANT